MTTASMLDRRDMPAVGRRARLELVFAVRHGQTTLVESYGEPPFRVGRTFPDGNGVHMILASSAPGIFSGDAFEQIIRLEPGARVRLTSQSSLQVHPSFGECSATLSGSRDEECGATLSGSRPATSQQRYHVADEARLHCHWDPMIPFAGAQFDQRIDIQLAETAQLYWSDAFMAGREGRGERWAFSSLAHALRVTRSDTLEYLERHRIVPTEEHLRQRWIGHDACYFGTTIVSGRTFHDEAIECLHGTLTAHGGLCAAVDRLAPRVVVGRLAAVAGVPFHSARALLSRTLA